MSTGMLEVGRSLDLVLDESRLGSFESIL